MSDARREFGTVTGAWSRLGHSFRRCTGCSGAWVPVALCVRARARACTRANAGGETLFTEFRVFTGKFPTRFEEFRAFTGKCPTRFEQFRVFAGKFRFRTVYRLLIQARDDWALVSFNGSVQPPFSFPHLNGQGIWALGF